MIYEVERCRICGKQVKGDGSQKQVWSSVHGGVIHVACEEAEGAEGLRRWSAVADWNAGHGPGLQRQHPRQMEASDD